MKRKNIFLLIMLLLFPTMVLASDGTISNFPVAVALGMEAFVTIHMSVFVLSPLANILDPDKSKKLFIKMFIGRILILLILDLVIPIIAIVDFMAVFVGICLIVPIVAKIKNVPIYGSGKKGIVTNTANTDNNVQVIQDTSPVVLFDETYMQTEKAIAKKLLIDELKLQGENEKNFITTSLNRRKNILLAILGIVTFIFTLMYYFNYSLFLCLFLELVALLIYYLIGNSFNVLNALTKLAIKHPDQDISTIVRTIREQKYSSAINSKIKFVVVILVIVLLPTIYFFNPRILYIKYSDGYSVLRYTRGIINDDNIVNIPKTYKGKQVLSISESAFKNSDVEIVKLPNGLESMHF